MGFGYLMSHQEAQVAARDVTGEEQEYRGRHIVAYVERQKEHHADNSLETHLEAPPE